jgi:hypothetical protein
LARSSRCLKNQAWSGLGSSTRAKFPKSCSYCLNY